MCIQLYAAFLVSVGKWAEKPARGALVRLEKKNLFVWDQAVPVLNVSVCGTSLREAASFSPAWTAVHQGKWCCALEKVYVIIQDKCVYVCEQSGNERVQIGYLCVQVCACLVIRLHLTIATVIFLTPWKLNWAKWQDIKFLNLPYVLHRVCGRLFLWKSCYSPLLLLHCERKMTLTIIGAYHGLFHCENWCIKMILFIWG